MQSRRRGAPASVAFNVRAGAGGGAGGGGSGGGDGAKGSQGSLNAILKQSRKSGQLNLSNRSLTEVPANVWKINIDTPEDGKTISMDNADDRWWEQVDLVKLILASNAIESISDDIRLLAALTVLDLHDNRLKILPDAVCELKCLTRMNVSHNQLTELPENLPRMLTEIQSLHLQHNCLTSIPDDIGTIAKLEDLDVSNNKLKILPLDIGSLTRLTKLNVAHNELQVLPHSIGGLQGLKVLEATHNQIHTLPDEIGFLRQLEILYLQHNRLAHLPHLEHCSLLKELHLGYNSIQDISDENLKSLQNLCHLDLRDNRMSKMPDEIVLLQSLERLDITNNSLSTLPPSLGTMTKLKSVILDGNPMKGIRRDIVQRGTNELKKYLLSRIQAPDGETAPAPKSSAPGIVDNKGLSGLIGSSTDGVDKHTVASTKNLDYCGKTVEVVPDDVWQVAISSNVTIVNLSRNKMTKFPEKLVEMGRSLVELNLSFNRIVQIEPFVGQLEKLVVLDVGNNLLTTLPDEIGSLQSLRELMISVNRFQNLPEVVYRLKKLEVLLANDNKIEAIDAAGLIGLSLLATLDLRNNNIAHVPPELGNCTQLRSCLLEGNAFRQPRAAVLSKGTGPLLEYLRGRISS